MDSLGLYDIYDYTYLPWWQSAAFKISIAILLFICFDVGVYFLVRRVRMRKKDQWELWHERIATLRTSKMNDTVFYAEITQLIKECSIQLLHAPSGVTDAELAHFLQADSFSAPVRAMGAIVERGNNYKYDPLFQETVSGSREKELVYMNEALTVIKQMVTKQ